MRPPLALTSASDSGLKGDGLTKIDTPSLRVSFVASQVSAGNVISVSSGGQVIGTKSLSAPEANAGVAQVTVSSLGADGMKSLTASIADRAGNISAASTALQISLDRTPPNAPLLNLVASSDTGISDDNITSDATPKLWRFLTVRKFQQALF